MGILLVLLMIAAGGYWFYKSQMPTIIDIGSVYELVPDDASSVIKIDTEAYQDLLLSESLKSPKKMKSLLDGFKKWDSEVDLPTKAIGKLLKQGLAVPKTFVLFEQSLDSSAAFATIFPIEKKETLLDFLKNDWSQKVTEIAPNYWFYLEKNLGIVLNEDQCLLLYSPLFNEENLVSQAQLIFGKKNKKEDNHPYVNESFYFKIEEKSHLLGFPDTWPAIAASGTLKHEAGNTHIELKITESDSEKPFFEQDTYMHNQGLLDLMLNVNTADYPLEKIVSPRDIHDLNVSLKVIQGNVSDLDKIWNGNIQMNLSKPAVIQERFVTYTYNDNFEKVEQVQIKETEIPDVAIDLSMTPDGLQHAQSKKWVSESKPMEVLAFPLFKLNANFYDQTLSCSSKERDGNIVEEQLKRLYLNVDCPEVQNYYPTFFTRLELESLPQYVKHIAMDDLNNIISIDVTYQDQEQNGLLSLMELIQALNTKEKEI